MCGIAAILSHDGPVDAWAVRRATRALRHRGPDAERTWVSPSGRIALGHRLLVINDPDGHQPIASEDGRLHIIVNGQFYDFKRIRAELEAKGHRFRTRSDSEIALHLYEDHGAGCLEHLRGQFAFVIWDEEAGTLFAARDRFGLKPLFYVEHEGALYLASEAKALFAAGVPREWDARGVYHWLIACPDERRSLFRRIRQVPPGHVLRAGNGRGARLERYWDLPGAPGGGWPGRRPRGGGGPASAPTFPQRRRPAPANSPKRRSGCAWSAGVPVGCLISGGLDSSSVLAVAATCTDGPVAAFTVGFERREFDESPGGTRGGRRRARRPHRRHPRRRRPCRPLRRRRLARRDAPVQHARRGPLSAQPGRARSRLPLGAGRRRAPTRPSSATSSCARRPVRPAAGSAQPGFCGFCRDSSAPPAATTPRCTPSPRGWPASPSSSPRPPRSSRGYRGGLGLIQSVCTRRFLHAFEGYDPYRALLPPLQRGRRHLPARTRPATPLPLAALDLRQLSHGRRPARHGARCRGPPPLPRPPPLRIPEPPPARPPHSAIPAKSTSCARPCGPTSPRPCTTG